MYKKFLSIILLILLCAVSAWAEEPSSAGTVFLPAMLEKAEAGDAEAQYEVGMEYLRRQDAPSSVIWWQKAADQGHPVALRELASLYEAGFGVEKDPDKAAELLAKAAELGDAEAQFQLGWLYYDGEVLAKDLGKTLELWQKAGNGGHAWAAYSAGSMYLNGLGTAQDNAQAVAWYEKATELGYFQAPYELGLMYFHGIGVEQDFAKALKWLEEAAILGSHEAKYALGFMYYNAQGVERDFAKALNLFKEIEEYEHPEAMYALGVMYSNGLGADKDYERALACYESSAIQQFGQAQYELGNMYYLGMGLKEKDLKQAYLWLSLAQANGETKGERLLKLIERKLPPKDLAYALVSVARSYFFGYGISQSTAKAYMWLLVAEELGEDVATMMGTMRNMSEEELAEAKSEAAKWLAAYHKK